MHVCHPQELPVLLAPPHEVVRLGCDEGRLFEAEQQKRGEDGVRLLPDGRPMQIVVESAGESSEESDILELVHDSLLKVGLKIFTKPVQREVFRNRIFSGETLFSVWGGLENGVPSAGTAPNELAPTSQQQLQWPKWGQHFQDKGGAGEPPGPGARGT